MFSNMWVCLLRKEKYWIYLILSTYLYKKCLLYSSFRFRATGTRCWLTGMIFVKLSVTFALIIIRSPLSWIYLTRGKCAVWIKGITGFSKKSSSLFIWRYFFSGSSLFWFLYGTHTLVLFFYFFCLKMSVFSIMPYSFFCFYVRILNIMLSCVSPFLCVCHLAYFSSCIVSWLNIFHFKCSYHIL